MAQEGEGEGQAMGTAEEGAEAMDTAEEGEVDATKPSKFPLAELCPRLQGKYVRLAFEKGHKPGEIPASADKTATWVWPMIVSILGSGDGWVVDNNPVLRTPLNDWARA